MLTKRFDAFSRGCGARGHGTCSRERDGTPSARRRGRPRPLRGALGGAGAGRDTRTGDGLCMTVRWLALSGRKEPRCGLVASRAAPAAGAPPGRRADPGAPAAAGRRAVGARATPCWRWHGGCCTAGSSSSPCWSCGWASESRRGTSSCSRASRCASRRWGGRRRLIRTARGRCPRASCSSSGAASRPRARRRPWRASSACCGCSTSPWRSRGSSRSCSTTSAACVAGSSRSASEPLSARSARSCSTRSGPGRSRAVSSRRPGATRGSPGT
ncbi:Uncharacterised protein [Mycobacteroides abscessus]|nr:Uncharacterised protein [Mycobacteroides abscessus]